MGSPPFASFFICVKIEVNHVKVAKIMRKLLFIGDSITAAGLREDPEQIGTGYVRLIHDYLKVSPLKSPIQIINKGVGGDTVIDLAARWTEDVISHHPDYLSISIGVNDVWRQLDNKRTDQVYPDRFEEVYDDLLGQVKAKTDAKIILMEPTIIEENIKSPGNMKLIPYVNIIHKLANKYDGVYIPTHAAFLSYLKNETSYQLTTDGVHMNSTGNMLMAKTWLGVMNSLL